MASGSTKETPPLPLVPEDDVNGDNNDSTKCMSFKLKASPGNSKATQKYSFTMQKVDGTQTIRQHIQWMLNLQKVFYGMEVATPADQQHLTEQMCSGAFKTAYTTGVEAAITSRWQVHKMTAVNALEKDVANHETVQQFAARKLEAASAVPKPSVEQEDLVSGIQAALTTVCPYRALELQKT